MKKITIESRAKLNLLLRVYGVRPDGYHEINSVMQTIDIADTLEFSLEEGKAGITIRSDDNRFPTGEDNLITKAYRKLAEIKEPSPGQGIVCDITKKIPMCSGMGGGSSNCAATLVALNNLLEIGLDNPALMKIGAEIGSDVPFFFAGGTCFVHGRGDKLELLPDLYKGGFVVVAPSFGVNTTEAYKAVDEYRAKNGIKLSEPPAVSEMIDLWSSAILDGSFEYFLHNDFEDPVFEKYSQIRETKNRLQKIAKSVFMTGSGSALFAYFSDYRDAWKALENFEPSNGEFINVAHPVSGGHVIYD